MGLLSLLENLIFSVKTTLFMHLAVILAFVL